MYKFREIRRWKTILIDDYFAYLVRIAKEEVEEEEEEEFK